MAMTGNGSNRWFDKCFTSIVYPEGTAAVNVEHSVIDATVRSHNYLSFVPHQDHITSGSYHRYFITADHCSFLTSVNSSDQMFSGVM